MFVKSPLSTMFDSRVQSLANCRDAIVEMEHSEIKGDLGGLSV